jgi:hypothetical protein
MLLRGDGRALLLGSAFAAGLGVIGGLGPLLKAGGIGPLIESVRGSMAVVATDDTFNEPTSFIRLDPVSLVGRAVGQRPGALVHIAFAIAILGGAGLLMRRLAERGEPEPRPISNSLGCLAILLSTYHQPYDALILALPLSVVLLLPGKIEGPRLALVLLLLVPGLNYAATHTLLDLVEVSRFGWFVISEVNAAALALALVLGMWMAWSRAKRGFSP